MKILWTLLALGWFGFLTHLALNTIYAQNPHLAGPAILVTTIVFVGYLARNGAK